VPTIRQRDVSADVLEKIQAIAGTPVVPKKRKPPDVRTSSSTRWSTTFALSCRVISEANRRDHWTVQRRRAEIQREALGRALVCADLVDHALPLPITVTWVHVGKQPLDDDNLSRSFKVLRDALAKWLDIDDGSPLVSWRYEQRTGEPGVVVAIEGRTP